VSPGPERRDGPPGGAPGPPPAETGSDTKPFRAHIRPDGDVQDETDTVRVRSGELAERSRRAPPRESSASGERLLESARGRSGEVPAAPYGQRVPGESGELASPPYGQRVPRGHSGERPPPPHGPRGREASSSGELAPLGQSGVGKSLAGRRLGPYKIVRLIAYGGMGAVYEAYHEGLQRPVALKTMHPSGMENEEDVERFLREAHAAARVSHPNLVSIHDVGEAAGIRFLAMELVRGENLHERIRRGGQLDEQTVASVAAGAAAGLHHAHEHGVLHRDLKPANIIVAEDGTPRVTDFGVAKAVGNARLTATGTALGTPSYMSPEQAMGLNEELDARTDVYGLGAIMYECLAGRPPFMEASHVATMQAVVNSELVPLRTWRSDLSRDLEAICHKCLEKEKEDRYADCAELIADLEACLAGATIQARVPALWRRLYRRAQQRALALSLALLAVAVLLAAAILVAQPYAAARRLERLESAAADAVDARLAEADAALAGDAGPADLRALLERLEPGALGGAVTEDLAPGGDRDRTAAVARGLARNGPLEARTRPVRARVALRLAGALPEEDARLDALARAERLDPDGAAGLRARLASVEALLATGEPAARRLAARELRALVAADEAPVAGAAARLLLELLAERGAWGEAAGLLPRVETDGRDAAGRERLKRIAALARWLGPVRELPARGPVAASTGRVVVADGGSVRVHAVTDDRELDRGEELWSGSGRVLLAAGDRDADGLEEVFVAVGGAAGTTVAALRGPTDVLTPLYEPVPDDRVVALATGDVDGDGRADLVAPYWRDARETRVVFGRERVLPGRPLAHLPGRAPFAIASVAAADLDGDGRDELLFGGSEFYGRLWIVRRDDPQAGFEPVGAPLELIGAVRDVVPYATGSRRGAAVVIDTARDHAAAYGDRQRASPPPHPWWGRDGVYLVELRGGAPSVVGRWTFGPDAAPSLADHDRARSVAARVVDLPDGPHVLRTAARADGSHSLELAPLDALALDANPDPDLALTGTEPFLAPGAQAADVDGDGDVELLSGDRVFGLGAPPGFVAAPAPTGGADVLARQVVRFAALGRAAASDALLRRLRDDEHAAAALEAAALGAVDFAIEAAEAAAARARVELARDDRAAGRATHRAAREGFAGAADRAEVLAESLAGGGAARAWEKSAYAWERAGEPLRAERALGLALKAGPSADRRGELESVRRAATRLADLEPVALDFAAADAGARVHVRSPLRCRLGPTGVEVLCSGDTESGVFLPVELRAPTLPLVLEAELSTLHGAWVTPVWVGLFPEEADGRPGPGTGLSLRLHDVYSGRLGLRPGVAGRAIGRAVDRETFRQSLRLRLELRPGDDGRVRVALEVRDGDGDALLHVAEHDAAVDVPRSGRALLGLWSPRGAPRHVRAGHGQWARDAPVVLRRLRLRAGDVRPRDPEGLDAAHAALAAGDAQRALTGYEALLDSPDERTAFEARFFRGLALGRLDRGGPAVSSLTEAVASDPYRGVLALEALADGLLAHGDARADRAVVASALHHLRARQDGLLDALVMSLLGYGYMGRGELTAGLAELAPPPGSSRERARAYLALREPAYDEATWWPRNEEASGPDAPVPPSLLPRVLSMTAPHRFDPAQLEHLVASLSAPGRDFYARYSILYQVRCAFPDRADARLAALRFYGGHDFHGEAIAEATRLLEAGPGPYRAQVTTELAALYAQLERPEAAVALLERALAEGLDPGQLDALDEALGGHPGFEALRAE